MSAVPSYIYCRGWCCGDTVSSNINEKCIFHKIDPEKSFPTIDHTDTLYQLTTDNLSLDGKFFIVSRAYKIEAGQIEHLTQIGLRVEVIFPYKYNSVDSYLVVIGDRGVDMEDAMRFAKSWDPNTDDKLPHHTKVVEHAMKPILDQEATKTVSDPAYLAFCKVLDELADLAGTGWEQKASIKAGEWNKNSRAARQLAFVFFSNRMGNYGDFTSNITFPKTLLIRNLRSCLLATEEQIANDQKLAAGLQKLIDDVSQGEYDF